MELKIENSDGLVLWVGFNDLVQVPMASDERTQCRKVLLDALALLDETIPKYDTFSTVSEMGEPLIQNPQHLSDCRAVFDLSHPSKQQEGTAGPKLRLVSGDPKSMDC